MAEQLDQNLWKLDIPLVGNPLKNLNSYLLTGGDRSLLIDTGFDQPTCLEAMETQLHAIGVDRSRLDIFLTHLHSDHTGLASRLIRENCHLYISSIDAPLMLEGLQDAYWRRLYQQYIANGFSPEEMERLWNTNPAQNDAPKVSRLSFTCLEDGDLLHYGGRTLRCILTPGHTPGHMCLYAEEDQCLFSGDHVLFHISPNICRWNTMPDALGSYLESLEHLRGLPVTRLLPAHRPETGALDGRIDELRAHHHQRIQNMLHVVNESSGLTAYEIAGRMKWSIRSKNWEDFPLTQKFFAVGETLAHLDYLVIRGKVVCKKDAETFRYYPSCPYGERSS